MPPAGARKDDGQAWPSMFEDAKRLADDTLGIIQERNTKHAGGGQEASRLTAAARKKLGALGTALDALRGAIAADRDAGVTENEANRRRDLVASLKARRERMLQMLRRDHGGASRAALFEGEGGASGGSAPGAPRETEATAGLDAQGLLTLQRQHMQEQDRQLEDMERAVTSTKHIARTVNEELDLQSRLLDELDEDVEVTHNRMRTAQKQLRNVMRRAGSCRTTCFGILLITALIVVILLLFKILAWF